MAADGAQPLQLRAQKMGMMNEIYRIMTISLGEPPKKFDWCFRDKNGKFYEFKNMTPLRYYKDIVNYPLTETLSLINDPRNSYRRLYTVEYLGNVAGGKPVCYVNVESETMKRLAIAVLQGGRPVWFGADVGKFSNTSMGMLDTGLYDYDLAFGVNFRMSKAERLLYGESLMTHAMVFTGVHLDTNGHPVRWRVENSWGDAAGQKGYFLMTDTWFTEYVYQIVLEKRDTPRELVHVLDQEAIVLPAYDPLGALA
jgi:bleomycin hydrolase